MILALLLPASLLIGLQYWKVEVHPEDECKIAANWYASDTSNTHKFGTFADFLQNNYRVYGPIEGRNFWGRERYAIAIYYPERQEVDSIDFFLSRGGQISSIKTVGIEIADWEEHRRILCS